MLKESLANYRVVLASGSPRRHELMAGLDIPFEVEVRSVEEVYPSTLKGPEITEFLSRKKASAFIDDLTADTLLITSDTIVWHKGRAVEKPVDRGHAIEMLKELSGDKHEVFTSVHFVLGANSKMVSDRTAVWFKQLSEAEISYYVDTYKPYDKAGSYGVQEWLGYIGIDRLEGSYFTVMGFPTHLVYKTLRELFAGGK